MGEFEKEILKTLVPAIISELGYVDKIKQSSSDNQVKQPVKTYQVLGIFSDKIYKSLCDAK